MRFLKILASLILIPNLAFGSASIGTSGTVKSVAFSVPATSIFSVSGSPVTLTGTLALATTGTSGGIPYFSSTSQLASSALLTANQLILGGGAGAAPVTLAAGSQYQVLRMGASTPAYGSINLDQSAAVTGTLPIANGGTNSTSTPTAGGAAYGDGSAFKVTSAGTSGQMLTSAGSSAPTWSNGVISDTTGTRTEYALIHCATSSSITTQSGSWLASITNESSGQCNINFSGSKFSAQPVCFIQSQGQQYYFYSNVTTSQFQMQAYNETTNANLGTTAWDGNVMCIGPK